MLKGRHLLPSLQEWRDLQLWQVAQQLGIGHLEIGQFTRLVETDGRQKCACGQQLGKGCVNRLCKRCCCIFRHRGGVAEGSCRHDERPLLVVPIAAPPRIGAQQTAGMSVTSLTPCGE